MYIVLIWVLVGCAELVLELLDLVYLILHQEYLLSLSIKPFLEHLLSPLQKLLMVLRSPG